MNSTRQDQVVVVTGASKGIGLACAQAFAAAGAKVALVARSRANLDAALGEIDVLVNLAGAARRTAPDDLNASNWILNTCSMRAPSPVRAGTVRCS